MDAREQLARIEGLGEVVVGTDLEPDDAIDVVALGSEHDDGCQVTASAKAAADRKTILAGQHQVEDDQIEQFALQKAVHRAAVLCHEHLESLLTQVAAQQVTDAGVVIDDEQAGGTSSRLRAHRCEQCRFGFRHVEIVQPGCAAQARPLPCVTPVASSRRTGAFRG
jgi:hypothetical protein